MKILTKLHLLELLKTKQAIAEERDGETVDITGDVALNWFDQILETRTQSYMLETRDHIWIAADKDEYKEENLWTITRTTK